MKRTAWIVLTLCLAGCSKPPVDPPESETVDPTTETAAAAPAGQPTEQPIIIDVRSKEEWDEGHLPQAIHIPHTEIAEKIDQITSDHESEIVLYCASGGRSGRAKETLEAIGFVNVENAGGYEDVKQRYGGEQP